MLGEILNLSAFTVGAPYSRQDIAAVGAVTPPSDPRDPHWSTGIVRFDNCTVLLVTLEKDEDYDYEDQYDGPMFWWQSQSRQTVDSPDIQAIASGERPAILFVRTKRKINGKTQPFTYCGRLASPVMEGERPVTCLFESVDYIPSATGALAEIYAWRPRIAARPQETERRAKIKASRASGQGRQMDPAVRRAIERHGMDQATRHYLGLGYEVCDTSAAHPWDLEVSRGSDRRRVEVKATQTAGDEVILTAGEVNAARQANTQTDLFVLSQVTVVKDGDQVAVSGGAQQLIQSWRPDDADLTPTEYRYRVPLGGR